MDNSSFCMAFLVLTGPYLSLEINVLNPLAPNIKEQILVSCPHTFLTKYWGEVIKISRKFTLGDDILNSHDLRG